MTSKPVLSICMIVKDEEKNLPRCLDSLLTVIEQIESELIVVDTGSTDNTVEIAQKYTKNVYRHEWNDSFSDMRNISIAYAKGEWILIIDADEELENPEDLIALLKDKGLNKINTIRFQVKNLTAEYNKKVYIILVSERIFKNDGQFMYRGTVHNQPLFKHPALYTKITLIHYGYIAQDKELMERKFERTGEMLKNELKKDPDNIYYRFQLARTYALHKEINNALEEIRLAYSLLERNFANELLHKYYVIGEYAKICFNTKRYEETINTCKKGMNIKPDYIDWYFFMGLSYFSINMEQEGYEALKKYFEIYEKYDAEGVKAIETYTYNSAFKAETALKLTKYLFNREQYDEALNYIGFIDKEKERIIIFIKIKIKILNYKDMLDFYLSIADEDEKNFFINVLEKEMNNIDIDEKDKIIKVFSNGDNVYSFLNRVRLQTNNVYLIKDFISKQDLNSLPVVPYAEVLKFALKNNIHILSLLRNVQNLKIKKYISYILHDNDKLKVCILQYLNNVNVNDFHGHRVYISIAGALLLNIIKETVENNMEPDEFSQNLFTLYIEHGIKYVLNLYQEEKFRIIYMSLDNYEDKFFILMYLAQNAIEIKNIKNAIKYFKEAAEVYPYIAALLNKKIKNIQA